MEIDSLVAVNMISEKSMDAVSGHLVAEIKSLMVDSVFIPQKFPGKV